jgi:hypothetical protein
MRALGGAGHSGIKLERTEPVLSDFPFSTQARGLKLFLYADLVQTQLRDISTEYIQ